MNSWQQGTNVRTIEVCFPTDKLEDILAAHLNAIGVTNDDEQVEILHELPDSIPLKLQITKEHTVKVIKI